MMNAGLLFTLIIFAIPFVLAVVLHEVAHGWVAGKLGDPTARLMGRITLNPLRHIDPVGTALVPALMYITTGFVFGWAKPVPVNWHNLRSPRRDMALVAVAGPAANFLMLLGWALAAKMIIVLAGYGGSEAITLLVRMCSVGILINVLLMVLNLCPVPPLDGGRIVTAMLPGNLASAFSRVEPYGLLILVVLLLTGTLWELLSPLIGGVVALVDSLVQLS